MKKFNPIKYLKLPFSFEKKKLQLDLETIVRESWISHYNKQAYEGDWKSLSLYSINGKEDNIFAVQNTNLKLKKTALMEKSKYFSEVIDKFKCQLLSVRLLKLSVGAKIKPHKDYKLGYEDDNFRIHIPIITNDNVNFILGGERIIMLSGECWYTNVNYTHSVSNEGNSDRIHLVIDCQRNHWSDEIFFSLAEKKDLINKEDTDLLEMYKNMIKELERLNEPISNELIKKYQQKIMELT